MLDVGRALASPFRGPDWRWRLAGAALLAIIPFLGWWLLAGYGMRIARRTGRGEEDGLPPWDDWGGLVADGWRFILVSIVWALPLFVPICFMMIAFFSLMMGTVGTARTGEAPFPLALLVVAGLFFLIVQIYAVFVSFIDPASLGRAAIYESAEAGLQFGDILRLVAGHLPIFLVVYLAYLGTIQLGAFLQIIPFLGIFLGWAYVIPVLANLSGQAVREASGWAAPVAALPPPVDPSPPLDVERAVREVFAPGWVGRLVGAAALVAVPVVGWVALLGYAARLTRRAAGGFVAPRPNWEDTAGLIGDGLRFLGVLVIWGVPIWTVQLWSWRQSVVGFQVFWESLRFSQPTAPPVSMMPSLQAFGLLTLLGALGVVAMCVVPAAMGQVATRRSFEAGFDLPVLWRTARRQPARYAAAVAIQLGSLGLISTGLVFLGIGALFAAGFAALLNGYLYGELVSEEAAPAGAG